MCPDCVCGHSADDHHPGGPWPCAVEGCECKAFDYRERITINRDSPEVE